MQPLVLVLPSQFGALVNITLPLCFNWYFFVIFPIKLLITQFTKVGFDKSYTFPGIYIHAVLLAIFSSLIAPFGGFFASGMKRAHNIKVALSFSVTN